MHKGDLLLWRGLANLTVWITWLFALPLALLFGLLVGEVFYWLAEAHWIRVTLCTLGNYMASANIPKVNQLLAHESDRCFMDTGARGLDMILNYCLNEASVFLSVSVVSILGVCLGVGLSGAAETTVDEIERRLKREDGRTLNHE
jgi:hypothetical protein